MNNHPWVRKLIVVCSRENASLQRAERTEQSDTFPAKLWAVHRRRHIEESGTTLWIVMPHLRKCNFRYLNLITTMASISYLGRLFTGSNRRTTYNVE